LHLDSKNPRLGRETSSRAPREIIQYLFEHDKAVEVADSIATRGYFPNEPLLAVQEDGRYVVVEGNRRLAALKALREPGLLPGSLSRHVERLARRLADPTQLAKVPVTIAPSRRATDRQIAARHVGTPVLAWQAENRASFILEKLSEGYKNEELSAELGFSLADIQHARQTRAIADMARSLDLPEEVKAKLDNPRAKLFTTLERVFDSTVGRDYLKVKPDAEHGLRGVTTKSAFSKAFERLVTDVALGKQSSRSLNTNENIRVYFESWNPEDRPGAKTGSFVPADIITGKSVASANVTPTPQPRSGKAKAAWKTVLPKDLKVIVGSARLVDIRRELTKLSRDEFPNAGAVLLRVFFELTAIEYLTRTGDLAQLVKSLQAGGNRLPHGMPTMKQLVPAIIRRAKQHLSAPDARKVEKAVRYDASAPFTISDLHGFVHSSDLPSDRDILQFWLRTEPMFRYMLTVDGKGT
jgi:ParB-like chromosome segregation protein Spo0J